MKSTDDSAARAADDQARLAAAREWLDTLFAPWVKALALEPVAVGSGECELRLPFDAALARVGGTICGQALMAAADTAMVIAIAGQLGEFKPMTTVGQTISFMRPVSAGDVRVIARVRKPGRTLVFGEIELIGAADGKLAAHATTTYALL
ncbi:MAG: PaaI family thioesterase [Lautropia sp.]